MRPTELERFVKRVEVLDCGCWRWIGAMSGEYGSMYFRGHNIGAHRVSYILSKGIPRPGMDVARTCNNKWCVYPHHLVEATHEINVLDAQHQGLRRPGKLTAEQVDAIRISADTRRALAERYGVSYGTIRAILMNETHRHHGTQGNLITEAGVNTSRLLKAVEPRQRPPGASRGWHRVKYTHEQVSEAFRMWRAGNNSVATVAGLTNINQGTLKHAFATGVYRGKIITFPT